jgi:hypothetical protein
MPTASRGSTDAGRGITEVLARCGEIGAHELGLGVVGAQHPHAVREGLLEQRDGTPQAPANVMFGYPGDRVSSGS